MVNIYSLLGFLKQHKVNTVLTLHAEFMYTAGCGHALGCEKWQSGCGGCVQKGRGRPSSHIFDRSAEEWVMMKEAFDNFETLVLVSVSKWTDSRARQSPFFLGKRKRVILNGIDTEGTFTPTSVPFLRERHGIKDERIVLHVTPNFWSSIKGGRHVLDLAQRFSGEDVRFIIVGYKGDKSHLPLNIIPVEHTMNQQELAGYYSLADVTLLTSQAETFSMVTAESLACGTPVVGFEAGGPETIAIQEFSEFVKQGNVEGLHSVLRSWIYRPIDKNEVAKAASSRYSAKNMYLSYLAAYTELIESRG